MSAESALTHAEVDYRKGNIDSKIRQHLTASSQEDSDESFARFIMAIDLTTSMSIRLLALHLSLSQRPLAEVAAVVEVNTHRVYVRSVGGPGDAAGDGLGDGAAPPRGLSGSSTMRRRPWRPPLQIFVSRGSSNVSPTKLATSERSRVARKRARPFSIAHDHPDQQGSMRPTVLIPDPAASERGLSNSIATRHRPRWPPLRSLASRGSVRDCLRSPATTRPSRGSVYTTVPFPDRAALARSLSYSTET
ncbi:hypothetical protein EDB86DRAFT_2835783 [Lactarius hatsudake]|nr:hypothetical protein EDB86DRAFT_2835783 [Lactarius hatsudake]